MWLLGGLGVDADSATGYLNDLWKFNPVTSEWTWMGGSSTVGVKGGQPGVYGKLGVAAAGNAPGSRDSAVGWADKSGYFWLFGGIGYDASGNYGELNDLWVFSPTTNRWAWIAGDSTLNAAGGRFGNYGRLGTPAAANAPGGRHSASTWTDSKGNLWLFGGGGFGASGDGGILDDLWVFNTTTRQWAWLGGPDTAGPTDPHPGVYGNLGLAASGFFPGGRCEAASWTDKTGNFWLLGGNGFDENGTVGNLNDLWELNPSTGQWAWIGGSSTIGSNGGRPSVYGAPGLPAPGDLPGSRISSATWADPSGNLWLFGGIGDDIRGYFDLLNDLWRYAP
jgi:N-acetylneuraminic acid mutarotase